MLYPKQLNSLEQLQAERASVKKKARKKAAELNREKDSGNNLLQEGIGFLSGALTKNSALAPIVETASKFAVPFLLKRGLQSGVRNVAGIVLREVGTGYLKWKAVDLVIRFAARKIKEKTKKEA